MEEAMSKRTGNRDGRAAKKRRARHRMRMERSHPDAYTQVWPIVWYFAGKRLPAEGLVIGPL